MTSTSLRAITVCGASALGGSEAFFVTLTLGLNRAGMNVRSVLKHNGIREVALREAGIPFDVLPFWRRFDFATEGRFKRIAGDFRPDVVLTITGRGAAMTPPGMDAAIALTMTDEYPYAYAEVIIWAMPRSLS